MTTSKIKIILIILAIVFTTVRMAYGQCAGVTLSTQDQVNNFQINYPGCTELGHLIITGNVNDLTPLNVLTKIENSLYIYAAHQLTDLTGLDNIKQAGNVTLWNCDGLNSLQGFNVRELISNYSKDVTILSCDELIDISQLSVLNPYNINRFWLTGNNNLSVCANLFTCRYLMQCDSLDTNISNNNDSCNSIDEILMECYSKDCPDFTNIGDPCNDYDSQTINDRIDDNCNCKGEIDCSVPPNDNIAGSIEQNRLFPNPAKDVISIPVNDLSPGLYFITAPDGRVMKFIKQ